MSKDSKNKIEPKLRFPEFNVNGEWKIEPLRELYTFYSTNTFSRDCLNFKSGFVRNIHYGDIHTKYSTLFDIQTEVVPFINPDINLNKIKTDNYCIEGDIVFADASEDLKDIGKSIEIVNVNNEKLVSGLHTLLARKKAPKFTIGFGGYLFMSTYIRTQIQKESQGTKVLGISSSRLSNIRVCYPINPDEQQKIASCLSSIDDLITAQSQKIDALKAHKKGLMQQLFPADGETVPKLRFKEFEESGEWKKEKLGKLGSVVASGDLDISCFSPSQTKEHIYPIYSNSVTQDGLYGYSTYSKYKAKSVTITARGTLGVAFARKTDFVSIGRLLVVSDLIDVEPTFLKEFWNHSVIIPLENGGIPQLTAIKAKEVVLLKPKFTEQQKIASCLSSLDDLITAHTQKLEALKAHKKGLMQQLFPSVNDIEA